MASPESMLLESAGGAFWATLIAFLVIVVTCALLWMMKKVIDQNGAFNAQIIANMKEIVAGMKEYKQATCDAIEKQNPKLTNLLETQQKTLTTLENRPCVARNAK